VVVGFDRDLPQADMEARAEALAGSVGAMVVDQYANMALLSVDPAADVAALAAQLSGKDGVVFAEPNYISWIPETDPLGDVVQLSEITQRRDDGTMVTRDVEMLKAMRTVVKGKVISTYPNDEFYNWGNSKIEHDIIWPNKNSSPAVCVIDTGADDRHPDLKGQIIKGYDFVNNDKVPNDDNGHGTHVSGTIAAKVNNGIGPAGISSGKVLAVKALNAQGWGTDFDISVAIYYCALNSSVKVINMSLGGSVPTSAKYNALDFAINYMGKLVVAAAGNSSVSDYSYPAGWAEDAFIGHGLLSVGASRMPTDWYGHDLWVDLNGNNVKTSDELFSQDDCAADFSNYGDWVEVIAPGESIYSTLPVSYPFWNNYFYGSSPGYESWNGTSMATPHVAGAAARTWSFYPGENNGWIHDRLIDRGYLLTIAEDSHVSIDPDFGYNNGTHGAVDYYGDPVSFGIAYDSDGDGEEDTIMAPFCWPDSTSGASFLSVAAAMDRGAFSMEVTDATTGLPLTGATVTVKHGLTGKTLTTAKMTGISTRWVDLINIPAQDPLEDEVFHPISVSMKGYTVGSQIIAGGYTGAGGYYWGKWFQVSVPPKNGTTVVANWYPGYDLDLFAFLPSPPKGVVGSGLSGHDEDMGVGTLMTEPYARWHRDGGSGDYLGVEAITVVNYPRSQYPYYLGLYPNGWYDFLIKDYNGGADLEAAEPIIRLWNNGKYNYAVEKEDECGAGENWWGAMWIERSGSYPYYWTWDNCGTGAVFPGGIWSYADGPAIFSTNHEK